MTKRERLRENYEEALFALLMDEVAVAQGKEALEENERLKRNPDAAVPEQVTKKCLRVIRQCFRREKARFAGRATWSIMKKVPFVAMLCTCLFVTAFAVSPQFRADTLNFVMETFEDELVLGFRSPNGNNEHLKPSKQKLGAHWIPEGFYLDTEMNEVTFIYYEYLSETGYIDITMYLTNSVSAMIDTEDAIVTDININGNRAKMISKLDENHIVWGNEEEEYVMEIMTAGLDKESLIKIAENLEIN